MSPTEIKQLQAEVAKLREIARAVVTAACDPCVSDPDGCPECGQEEGEEHGPICSEGRAQAMRDEDRRDELALAWRRS